MNESWLVTIKGNDTFVYDCELTGSEFTILDKVQKLLAALAKTTIEKFVSITVTKL